MDEIEKDYQKFQKMKKLELKAIELEKAQIMESGLFGRTEDIEMKKIRGAQ